MKNPEYYFEKIYAAAGIFVSVWRQDKVLVQVPEGEFYQVCSDAAYRRELMRRADDIGMPVFYEHEQHVWMICAGLDDTEGHGYVFFGPVCFQRPDMIALHRYYYAAGMRKGMERPIPVLSYTRMLAIVELVMRDLTGEEYTDKELMDANMLDRDALQGQTEEQTRFRIGKAQEDLYHHTYQEERHLLDCVREGNAEEALRMNMLLDEEMGQMSSSDEEQWRKTVIVGIALTTRAAIEGGIPPREAYELSDYYMQKMDQCRNVPELIACRNQAVENMTARVRRKQEMFRTSSYVEQCCDYVGKHYREKIYLEDIADRLGISRSYLSKLFSREMGIPLQEYIVKIRVDRAANLLRYSDESISKIGDYVNFPSQSYFGRIFRKYMHMTPGEYRNRYKPKEFHEKE